MNQLNRRKFLKYSSITSVVWLTLVSSDGVIAELLDKRLLFNDHETVFPGFEVPEYLGIFEPKS